MVILVDPVHTWPARLTRVAPDQSEFCHESLTHEPRISGTSLRFSLCICVHEQPSKFQVACLAWWRCMAVLTQPLQFFTFVFEQLLLKLLRRPQQTGLKLWIS